MGQGQANERAPGQLVEDRGPLPGQVGQEDEAVGTRLERGRLRLELVERPATTEQRIAQPGQGSPGRGHRPAQDPAPIDWRGGGERPGQLERPIGVDAEPARCAAGVDRVAGREESRPEHARGAVVHPGHDREPGDEPELLCRGGPERAKELADRDRGRDPGRVDPGRPKRVAHERRFVRLERGGGPAGQPEPEGVPRAEQPAGGGHRPRIGAGEPGEPGQEPEPGRSSDPAVLPGDRRPDRAGFLVEGGEGGALADAADRDQLDPGRVEGANGGGQGAPPVGRILLGAPVRSDLDRAGLAGDPERPTVQVEQARLRLARPQVEAEDRARHRPAGP